MSIDSATTLPAAAAAGTAAVACFRAAARGQYGSGRAWTIAMRRALRLLGASAAVWALGRLLQVSLALLLDGPRPSFPGPADAVLLAAIPLAALGLLAYPTAPGPALARVRTLLDGLLIVSSLLFVCWATVLGPSYSAAGRPVLPRAIGLAYPVGDVVTMTIVLSLLARTRGRWMLQPVLLTAAILAIGLADAGLAYQTAAGAGPGALVSAGWFAGYLLLAGAALCTTPAGPIRRGGEEILPLSWPRLALSYLPPATACLTAATVELTRGQLEPFLVLNGIAIVLFVVARQVVATVENRRLHRRLRDTVDRLCQREAELETALRREYAATDRLRAMSGMKDTFLRAVSHDLRTPLTAMHGVAVTLERTRLTLPREQALDLIRMMIEKTRKMDRLLADLLDLNRMEEGILEPNRSPTDVRALAHRVVEEVEQLRGWPIEIEADAVLAAVDGPKVERVLENLLLNTTRHTPPGTQVWVRALTRERDLELIVEDAGPGVPAELAGTIFEPFRRARPGATPGHGGAGRGVGIGLSLVARFAELHGGRAWVTERAGGGACFHVLLPACVSGVSDGDEAGAPGRPRRPGDPSPPAQPVLLPSARE